MSNYYNDIRYPGLGPQRRDHDGDPSRPATRSPENQCEPTGKVSELSVHVRENSCSACSRVSVHDSSRCPTNEK